MPVIRHVAITLKNPKKTLDKQTLCFYDFLIRVFAARFSGERRTGGEIFAGDFSIADLGMQVVWVGNSGGWLAPQSLVFFQMTGFFQKVVVVACKSL